MKINKQTAWCILFLSITICFSNPCKEPYQVKVRKINQTPGKLHMEILYDVSHEAEVKCVIYDKNMEPIKLYNEFATPPMDRMIFILPDKEVIVESAKCWIIDG